MKKSHQFLATLLLVQLCAGLQAQLFTDDFEAYEIGDSISLVSEIDPWVLWSGLDTEEAFVSDDVALSGTNSLKFEGASAEGGPQDIVLVAGLEGSLLERHGRRVRAIRRYSDFARWTIERMRHRDVQFERRREESYRDDA